ncbi:MAG: EthD domain-containing protein [Acidimicrobiia bacterium]
MIHTVMCIRRRPDMDAEEFRRCGRTEHGERVRRAAAKVGTVRSVQCHTTGPDREIPVVVQPATETPGSAAR